MSEVRHLVLVLGDQLDHASAAFEGFDPARDRVLMIEAAGESTHVWSHKARTALFLSAMRHFADALRGRGWTVDYRALGEGESEDLVDILAARLRRYAPRKLVLVEPGEWRLEQAIRALCERERVVLDQRDDLHFMISRAGFADWAKKYRQLRMEFFYRMMRERHGVLMEGGEPAGGRWNFDADNRSGFGRKGPGLVPPPLRFEADAITREVLAEVEARFAGHPGSTAAFDWPVTREQALAALSDFVEHRLELFGHHQDAMWTGQPWLWHARISAAMNLKLLSPREVIAAAVAAWRERGLPLQSVEGFVRQVIGWREFIRGMYWLDMPRLRDANHYGHARALPRWYWTGDTGMNCMRAAIGQTLRHGYAHHIQRLMVTGQFALLAEIAPRQVEDWYLAVYVDAVEWVELPNVAGMALYADGGRFTSKPYVASGAYIQRMSNYCDGCRYSPSARSGEAACPVTVLYWHFLDRHEAEFAANPRTALMAKNLQKLAPAERAAIGERARQMLEKLDDL
ncbi:cryptochrome/photolyase family protein [Methyloversatilis discipulorum]|uniref:cryptochrome/photolyase family protein n=1 Tax=Methyloversatilis discipulorum TaxID=1119528 RepID=UPI001A5E351B|nr:cryptochrome/photolyase family protein [Methyloversatilis discipulorum]MBL8466645.1 cryptochrome/photolyase family protein [Methyloversatilis discipulorum]